MKVEDTDIIQVTTANKSSKLITAADLKRYILGEKAIEDPVTIETAPAPSAEDLRKLSDMGSSNLKKTAPAKPRASRAKK